MVERSAGSLKVQPAGCCPGRCCPGRCCVGRRCLARWPQACPMLGRARPRFRLALPQPVRLAQQPLGRGRQGKAPPVQTADPAARRPRLVLQAVGRRAAARLRTKGLHAAGQRRRVGPVQTPWRSAPQPVPRPQALSLVPPVWAAQSGRARQEPVPPPPMAAQPGPQRERAPQCSAGHLPPDLHSPT